jgi:CheY-specific phosphatase CheX
MNTMSDQRKNYAIAILIGAIGGGLFVTLATKAIPKMMTQMMSGMMQNMMSRMSESGCDPSEM